MPCYLSEVVVETLPYQLSSCAVTVTGSRTPDEVRHIVPRATVPVLHTQHKINRNAYTCVHDDEMLKIAIQCMTCTTGKTQLCLEKKRRHTQCIAQNIAGTWYVPVIAPMYTPNFIIGYT